MNKLTKRLPRQSAKTWPEMVRTELSKAWQWQKDLVITIVPDEETRRSKQNSLLWLLHTALAKHIEEHQGQVFDTEEIHEYVSAKLIGRRAVTMPDGEPMIVRNSTRKLAVKEFAEMIERYYVLASETYGCSLPRPDDLYWDAVMRQPPDIASNEGM